MLTALQIERLVSDTAFGEFERGSVHVGVPAVLYQGRNYARRLNGSQHPAGHPAVRTLHPE